MVASEALSWIGTPYRHKARIKGVGVDCLMLVAEVFEKTGVIEHVDIPPYAVEWHLHRNEEKYLLGMVKYCRQVEKPQQGDIGLWKFGRCFSHSGIFIDDNTVVHSYLNRGVIRTRLDEAPLQGREQMFFSRW